MSEAVPPAKPVESQAVGAAGLKESKIVNEIMLMYDELRFQRLLLKGLLYLAVLFGVGATIKAIIDISATFLPPLVAKLLLKI